MMRSMSSIPPSPADNRTAPDDVLSSIFRLQVLPPQVVLRVDLQETEQAHSEGDTGSCLCIVLSGAGVLQSGRTTIELGPGDAALLPRHPAFVLGSSNTAYTTWSVPSSASLSNSSFCRIIRRAHDTPNLSVIIVPLSFQTAAPAPLFTVLPDMVRIAGIGKRAQGILELLDTVTERRQTGDASLAASLAQALVLLALQTHLVELDDPLLHVLHDPRLIRAVTALHGDLSQPWTVRELSRIAGMSESLFRSRLRTAVGEPWRNYIQRVRIREAERLLASPGASVAQVAASVGYNSESSFSRAFLGIVGCRPGQFISDHTQFGLG